MINNMPTEKEKLILSYIGFAIPDIARKCGVMQEEVIECFKYFYEE